SEQFQFFNPYFFASVLAPPKNTSREPGGTAQRSALGRHAVGLADHPGSIPSAAWSRAPRAGHRLVANAGRHPEEGEIR
ncbi:hypothetical protein, partial [Rhodoplanes sp. SY1]|uniref:hypothetical protein n=1 Tax=Rhodoplanes sp. SY1 TaxID=3166646 RepID=UPI0038B68013